MEGIFWILIAVLGSRQVFRVVIPRRMPNPSFERYVLSWIAISIWCFIVAFLVGWISPRQ
jgi:hypothetical protein